VGVFTNKLFYFWEFVVHSFSGGEDSNLDQVHLQKKCKKKKQNKKQKKTRIRLSGESAIEIVSKCRFVSPEPMIWTNSV
jgi:hypothetical protein